MTKKTFCKSIIVFVFSIFATFFLLPGKDAKAVTWGEPDTDHEYAGGLLAFPPTGPSPRLCSGAFFSPNVFITAAHCVDDVAVVIVGVGSPLTLVTFGTPFVPTEYNAIGDGPDVAVVVTSPITLSSYAQLPSAGVLTGQSTQRGNLNERIFQTVGYGIQGVSGYKGEGVLGEQIAGLRQVADLSLLFSVGTNSFGGLYAWFSSNSGKPTTGGACLGDSGGPVLVKDTNTVVAINSAGTNENCAGTGIASRLDVDVVLGFLSSFGL